MTAFAAAAHATPNLPVDPVTLQPGATLDFIDSDTFTDPLDLAGDVKFNVGTGLSVNQEGAITGVGGFEKTGDGELNLWSPVTPDTDPQPLFNTYEGNTLVSAGRIVLHGPDGISDVSAVTVGAAGTLALSADIYGNGETIGSLAGAGTVDLGTRELIAGGNDLSTTFSGTIVGAGTFVKMGIGTLILTGTNSYDGGTTIAEGAIDAQVAGALGTGPVDVAANAALTFSGTATAGSLALTNAQRDGNGGLIRFNDDTSASSAGITNLSGASTEFWGNATADQAVIDNAGQVSFYDKATAATAQITNHVTGDTNFFNTATAGAAKVTNDGGDIYFFDTTSAGSATLTNTDNGRIFFIDESTADDAKVVNTSGTVSIRNLTSEGIAIGSLSGAGTISLGNKALTLGGLDQNDLISGSIVSTANAGSLNKIGLGTLTLSGANGTFSGATTVSGGTLDVTGALGGNVSVASGGTLAGTGTLGGATTIQSGGTLKGTSGATLSFGSLALNDGAIVSATLGTPTSTALFNVTGDLTLNGSLDVATMGGFGVGVYRLFDYGGTLSGAGLSIGETAMGVDADSLSVQTAVAGRVNLVNTAGQELRFWDGANALAHDNGLIDGGNGVWNADNRNWTNADGAVNGPMKPVPTFAVFGNAGGEVTIDGSNGAVEASGMQFAVNGYALSGASITLTDARSYIRVGDGTLTGGNYVATISSELTGAATLVKSDLGKLILTGANTYSGGTSVEGGTLIGSSTSIRGDLANAGTVIFAQTENGTFGGAISGNGALFKDGRGTLTLSGDGSAYVGATTIRDGGILLTGKLASNVTIKAGGSLQVGDNGTTGDLTGATINDGILIFARSGDYDYTGALSGGGVLIKRGPGLLLLSGDFSYTGSTQVDGGSVTLNAALNPETDLVLSDGIFDLGNRVQTVAGLSGTGGTVAPGATGKLTVDQNTDTTFAGGISGQGTFVKAGIGRLNLTGTSTFTGSAIVAGGRLSVNGTVPGQVDVLQQGTIGGTGTIGGLIVRTGGTAAPGNSIGLLNVASDVRFDPGSVYQVEANATVLGDGFGSSDRIAATGSVQIAGGTVQVIAAAGQYQPLTTYRILTAQGGRTGEFQGATDNLAYLDSVLSYDANTVYLKLIRNDINFAAMGTTANQRATASAVEALKSSNAVYQAAMTLTNGTAGAAFDQLSGEIYSSARNALVTDAALPRTAILSRLSSIEGTGSGAWAKVFGNWGSIGRTTNAAAVNRDTTGFLLGVDAAIGENWTVGSAGGRTATDLRSSAGNGTVKATHMLAYAGAQYGNVRVKAGLGFAAVEQDIRRTVAVSTLADSRSDSFDGERHAFSEI